METGMESKTSLRYININQIYQIIGENVRRGLPALNTFTGSDYTSAFNQKGKVWPLKWLEKDKEAQQAFANIAEDDLNDGRIVAEI